MTLEKHYSLSPKASLPPRVNIYGLGTDLLINLQVKTWFCFSE